METSGVFNNMPPVGQFVSGAEPSQKVSQPLQVKDSIPATDVKNDKPEGDLVELQTTDKKEKKGIIKSVKGFIANIKKTFATAGEYIKGTAKGITAGAVGGSVIYTAGSIFNGLKKHGFEKARKAAEKAGEAFEKTMPKKIPNKALAIIFAIGAVAVNLWNASLNATQKQSEIDHRWTGHNNS